MTLPSNSSNEAIVVALNALREDIADQTNRLETAIKDGSSHRQEMDVRLTKVEGSYISFKQAVMWLIAFEAFGITVGVAVGHMVAAFLGTGQ